MPDRLQLGSIVLAGRYAAYVIEEIDCYGSSPLGGCTPEYVREPLYRQDVKTGRFVRLGGAFSITVTDFVLTSSGTVAWIRQRHEPPGQGPYEVVVAKARASSVQVLASSITIDPHSLAAIPGHLYWTEGGEPREATIE